MISLGELMDRGLAKALYGEPTTLVHGVHHDSRSVERGDLYVAIAGSAHDGTDFVQHAIERGAVAVAAEKRLSLSIPQLQVEDARRALGSLAAVVYDDPTADLDVVGVTGTNGKTTTVWLLEQALTTLGAAPAMLSTVESRVGGQRLPATFTTPEGDAIARFARDAKAQHATHLLMEVSSHALAQFRADAVHFQVAAFTNLSQDHLDFHRTMEAYFEAKARLFRELDVAKAVIQVDSTAGRQLAADFDGPCTRVSARDGVADLRVSDAHFGRSGLRARIELSSGESVQLTSPMVGAHNLENLSVAFGCLLSLGFDASDSAEALALAPGAPGRLERIEGEQPDSPLVLVDYAHTPAALEQALAALRPITDARLIVVFGCGGDRDVAKRPLMGEIAVRGADAAVLTSDNPRSEDPSAIIEAIETGARSEAPRREPRELAREHGYALVEDRAEAIATAIEIAASDDTVLIAGKGHETGQILKDRVIEFDDRKVARMALRRRER